MVIRGSQPRDTVIDLNFYRDWISRRAQARDKDTEKPTFFVTISREFGCEGYDVAVKLVEKISASTKSEWNLFTRKMIEEMVASDDLAPELVHKISEKRWSFKDWFVDALVPDYLQSDSSVVFGKMKKFILNLADKGNCVILGAGSQIVTQALDPKKFHGIHIRVVAPYSWRLRRVEGLFSLTREETEKTLRNKQDSRDKFIADFSGLDSADPALYHIIFNNARNTPDCMAETIVGYLKTVSASA